MTKTYGNETTEVYRNMGFDGISYTVHDLVLPDAKARFAMELMKVGGMTMLLDTYPDSNVDRDPKIVANTICEVADATFDEFRARGWLIDIPSMGEK